MIDIKHDARRGAFFLFAALLHGGLICFLSFSVKPEAEPLRKPAVKSIRLVQIEEEAPPAPPKPEPQIRIEPAPAPQPASKAAAVPAEFIETQREPAQTKPETSPPASAVRESAVREPAVHEPAVPAAGAGKPASDGALKSAYIEKNFNYIQRRIKEKLVYPAEAKRAGLQGTVEAVFTVHPDGSVSGVTVRAGSGQVLLDQAAVDAIYAAAPFRPPPPSAVKIAVPVSFRLR